MKHNCPICGKTIYSKPGPDDNIIIYCSSPPNGCGWKDWIKDKTYNKYFNEDKSLIELEDELWSKL